MALLDPNSITFASLADAVLAQSFVNDFLLSMPSRFSLRIAIYRIEIICTSEPLLLALQERFGDFETLEPGSDYDFQFHIARDHTRLLFWSNPARVKHYVIPENNLSLSVFFADLVFAHELFSYHRIMSMHAAVVGQKGCVAAIVGDTTAGKTTTAVACARNGMTFYSDERCLLQDGVLYPFPRALTLRPGGRKCLLADQVIKSDRLHYLLQKCPIDVDVQVRPSFLFEQLGNQPEKLKVIFLIREFADRAVVEEVSLVRMLPEIMRSVMLSEMGVDRVVRVLTELSGVRIFSLMLGTPQASAEQISQILQVVE